MSASKEGIQSGQQQKVNDVTDRAAAAYDQTRQAISDAYDKTAKGVSATYDQVIAFGKQNPGMMALIAFGAGISVGLLLASGLSSRGRVSNIIEPIGNALTQIGLEIFR